MKRDSLCGVLEGLVFVEPVHNEESSSGSSSIWMASSGSTSRMLSAVVQRRLLVVKRRETHALEVPTVSLLTTHHDPHGSARWEEKKPIRTKGVPYNQGMLIDLARAVRMHLLALNKQKIQLWKPLKSKQMVLRTEAALTPLRNVDRLYDPGDFIDKRDGSCDVVEHGHISNLFPGHGHVLQQLQHGMGHILQRPAEHKEGQEMWVLRRIIKKAAMYHSSL